MRRRSAPPDSLELLLDTICNTFGGVLFLAILIAVLIRTSSKIQDRPDEEAPPATPVSAEEWYKAEANLQKALSEREALEKAIERQTALLGEIAGPEFQEALGKQKIRDEARRKLLEQHREALGELAELQEKLEGLDAELAGLDRSLADLPRHIEDAKKELEKQIAARTQASRMSRTRTTSKREVSGILRYGRFYLWHHYDEHGNRLGVNTDDMLILEENADEYLVEPKPFGGAVVADNPAATAALSRILARFDRDKRYLGVVVYPDSFKQFGYLKKLFIERGFEYRLMPTEPGERIVDRGGRGGRVQ